MDKEQARRILAAYRPGDQDATVHHALDSADRAYVMETGRITLEGPAAELRHDPRIERSYLGH